MKHRSGARQVLSVRGGEEGEGPQLCHVTESASLCCETGIPQLTEAWRCGPQGPVHKAFIYSYNLPSTREYEGCWRHGGERWKEIKCVSQGPLIASNRNRVCLTVKKNECIDRIMSAGITGGLQGQVGSGQERRQLWVQGREKGTTGTV